MSAFVLLGTVVRAHGIRGEVKIRPHTEQPDNICRYERIILATDPEIGGIACAGKDARVSGQLVLLKVPGCIDRNRAEQLVGRHVWLAVGDLPPAESGEVYLHTLMGKQARTADGQRLGTIAELLSGAQDLLVIRDADREYLVPAVRDFISAVDDIEVVLDLPSGLLELNR